MLVSQPSGNNTVNKTAEQSKESSSVIQENKLRKIMTMTPGESAKDKGVLFLELREICSYFYTQFLQSQVYQFSLFPLFLDSNRKP
jgi:hypothetical protein